MYGCYLNIKLTSMCEKSICTYKTYQHDAKYVFELYSMTLQTFSYVVPDLAIYFLKAEYIIQVMNSAVKDK
jgi:hypothetical protein